MPTVNFTNFIDNSNLHGVDYIVGFTGIGVPLEFKTTLNSIASFVQSNTYNNVSPNNLTLGGPSWDSSGNLTLSNNGSLISPQVYFKYPTAPNIYTGVNFYNESVSFFVQNPSISNLTINQYGQVIINPSNLNPLASLTLFGDLSSVGDVYVSGNIYGTAQKAVYAGLAAVAQSSDTCTGRAAVASLADYATYAERAGVTDTATLAISSSLAYNSQYASNAVYASNANYATSAGTANNAVNANQATNANLALSALNANYASNAGLANSAGNADYATSAGTATNANYATNAGHALSADYIAGGIQNLNVVNSSTVTLYYNSSTLTLSANAAIVAADGNPLGTVLFHANTTPPPGYVICDGGSYSISGALSGLYNTIGYTYGNDVTQVDSNSMPYFRVPDLRGEFIRGYDAGRGVDAGRVFGSSQGDLFKSHSHTFSLQDSSDTSGSGDAYASVYSANNPAYVRSTAATGGSETRPRNVTLLPIIKAYYYSNTSNNYLNTNMITQPANYIKQYFISSSTHPNFSVKNSSGILYAITLNEEAATQQSQGETVVAIYDLNRTPTNTDTPVAVLSINTASVVLASGPTPANDPGVRPHDELLISNGVTFNNGIQLAVYGASNFGSNCTLPARVNIVYS